MSFIIVSGLSGSGKSTVLRTLEDAGYFMIDNLPPELWSATSELCLERGLHRTAVSTDSRTRDFLASLETHYAELSKHRQDIRVLFLEANAEVLLRRYNCTRREHPLGETLMVDLARERELLAPLRSIADTVIDTTKLSELELSDRVLQFFGIEKEFSLRLMSFGFKHSPPRDVDMIIDVRSLPNPYWEESMKNKTGLAEDVSEYVFTTEQAQGFYREIFEFIKLTAQRTKKSGRCGYTVGIGCTGGQHRSVAVVEKLAKDLKRDHFDAHVSDHRDLPTMDTLEMPNFSSEISKK